MFSAFQLCRQYKKDNDITAKQEKREDILLFLLLYLIINDNHN